VRGVVYTGEGRAEVTNDLDVDAPGPHDVLVRLVASGLCHTDQSVLDGTIPWPAPAVLGHEGAGVVEAVGREVTLVAPGDHVVVSTIANCGWCRYCNTGHPTRCRSSIGVLRSPFSLGGEPCHNFAASSTLSELTLVKEVQAVPIDRDVPLATACIIACGVLTGAGSVWNAARVQRGETAVVFGLGGVGLSAVQALEIAGASRIVAVDTIADKEPLARAMGATDFVWAGGSPEQLADAVRELFPHAPGTVRGPFGSGGVDWAFECTGNPHVLRTAIEVLDWGGGAVAIGVPAQGTDVSVPVNHMVHLDRKLIGARYGESRPRRDIPLIVDLYMAGRFRLDAIITKSYPLEDFAVALDDLRSGRLGRGVLTI
jgi:S-(hydroxymethyl)glutathione dehydrogenase/alcohol dehydrogenase